MQVLPVVDTTRAIDHGGDEALARTPEVTEGGRKAGVMAKGGISGGTWNYRIVKYHGEEAYGLHEVHYSKDGTERAMSSEPCGFVSESPEELMGQLLTARTDAKKRPVFEQPKDWTGFHTRFGEE